MISHPPKHRTRSPMNSESSEVTPIRKHIPSKQQRQASSDKVNAQITELEKKLVRLI